MGTSVLGTVRSGAQSKTISTQRALSIGVFGWLLGVAGKLLMKALGLAVFSNMGLIGYTIGNGSNPKLLGDFGVHALQTSGIKFVDCQ